MAEKRKPVGLRLTESVLRRVDQFAAQNGITRTAAVELLLRKALAK